MKLDDDQTKSNMPPQSAAEVAYNYAKKVMAQKYCERILTTQRRYKPSDCAYQITRARPCALMALSLIENTVTTHGTTQMYTIIPISMLYSILQCHKTWRVR